MLDLAYRFHPFLLGLAALVPPASASAASQFSLNPLTQASACFIECHNAVTSTIWGTDDPRHVAQAITANCKEDLYTTTMSQCLPQYCASAPDAAYAVEYGNSFCRRAGVDVSQRLVLPESYTQGAAAAYFNSAAYLSSSASEAVGPSMLFVGATALLLPAFFK